MIPVTLVNQFGRYPLLRTKKRQQKNNRLCSLWCASHFKSTFGFQKNMRHVSFSLKGNFDNMINILTFCHIHDAFRYAGRGLSIYFIESVYKHARAHMIIEEISPISLISLSEVRSKMQTWFKKYVSS